MNKQELWEAVCERYPEFKDDEHIVKQRARGLRRLLGQAWDEGHDQGVKNGRALAVMEQEKKAKSDPFRSIFP